MSLNDLRASWTTLYKHTLPTLAINKSPVQERWPVHIDHCFARIILDSVIGVNSPWTAKLRAPAWKNMSAEQLKGAIDVGQQIAVGALDLAELDDKSLTLRGKIKYDNSQRKRKRQNDAADQEVESTHSGKIKTKVKSERTLQSDIRSSFAGQAEEQISLPSPPPTPTPIDARLLDLIASSNLTPFRQRVLLALCQVPSGSVTTYAAMSNYLCSCPRAVGNALRNNPFAPRVPCHRVVASGGGIGGFGGEWGAQGKHASEKVNLLKQEGVRVNRKGERVLDQIWTEFV